MTTIWKYDLDVEHIRTADGSCVISLNGQGHLPCSVHGGYGMIHNDDRTSVNKRTHIDSSVDT